jgi:2,3-bisphosphoglycerate-dependent phosphoglycerate mutase
MKRLVIFLFILCAILSCQSNSQESKAHIAESNIYLVRHAEKVDDETKDPGLTPMGLVRANRIAQILLDADIDYIYSTDYQRTRLTAEPLSIALGKEVLLYDPSDLKGMVDNLKSHAGKNIVIVGHSNTTPTLTNLLVGEEKYTAIDETDYTNLFIVTQFGNHKSSKRLHF